MPNDDAPLRSTGITIGTDPELVCLDPKTNEPTNIAEKITTARFSVFGADGHEFIAELRPKAAVFPRDLTENVRTALLRGYGILSKTKWLAGPFVAEKPLGGHIHIAAPLSQSVVEALDFQFAPILALIEPLQEARTRRNTIFVGRGGHVNNHGRPYGGLSDVRKKPYGFEYRTPSSFIVTPGLTLSLFTLFKAIVWEELQKGECAWSKLPPSIRNILRFSANDFRNCDRKIFLSKLNTLWPLFEKMLYFKPGMEGRPLWSNVAYLKQCIKQQGFNTKSDIKKPWKVTSSEFKRLKPATSIKSDNNNNSQLRAIRTRAGLGDNILDHWAMDNGVIFRTEEEEEVPFMFDPDIIMTWL